MYMYNVVKSYTATCWSAFVARYKSAFHAQNCQYNLSHSSIYMYMYAIYMFSSARICHIQCYRLARQSIGQSLETAITAMHTFIQFMQILTGVL